MTCSQGNGLVTTIHTTTILTVKYNSYHTNDFRTNQNFLIHGKDKLGLFVNG